MCLASLLLEKFVKPHHPLFTRFHQLSLFFFQKAFLFFKNNKEEQTLHLVLFQSHFAQKLDESLINLFFENAKYFREILNIPQIYKVLSQRWIGNFNYNNNPLLETFSYQTFQSSYNIIISNPSEL